MVTGGDFPTDPLGEVCHVVHRVACDVRRGVMIHPALHLHPLGECGPSASGARSMLRGGLTHTHARTRAHTRTHVQDVGCKPFSLPPCSIENATAHYAYAPSHLALSAARTIDRLVQLCHVGRLALGR